MAEAAIRETANLSHYFLPTDLTPYPHILKYLRRIGEREAFRRAMQKGDADMALLLT